MSVVKDLCVRLDDVALIDLELKERSCKSKFIFNCTACSVDLHYDKKNKISYRQYKYEKDLYDIMALISKDLSEPYSIYTYRYFLYNWPELCVLVRHYC